MNDPIEVALNKRHRRLLAAMRVVLRYASIRRGPRFPRAPRVVPRVVPRRARSLRRCFRELTITLLLAVGPAHACDGLRADGGWVRLPPPNAATAAAYFTLTNHAAHPVTIVAVSSPGFGHAMLHETRYVDGRAEMRHLGDFTLAPGEVFVAAPGAAHVMLGAPREPLELEHRVELILECRLGDPLRLTLPIKQHAP